MGIVGFPAFLQPCDKGAHSRQHLLTQPWAHSQYHQVIPAGSNLWYVQRSYYSLDKGSLGKFENWILQLYAAAAAKSLQSCPTLCNPIDGSPPGSPLSLGFSRQEHWSGLPFPSPMHESEKWKWSRSVVSDSRDPMDYSLPGSSVHGIFQAKELEWCAII